MTDTDEQIRNAIAEQAAEWYVRNEAGSLGDRERAEFIAWLRASPRHVEEYLGVATLVRDLPAATARVAAALQSAPAAGHADPLPRTMAAEPALARWWGTFVGTRATRLPIAVAAAAALLAVAMVIGARWLNRTATQVTPLEYRTAHGQQAAWSLADGSVIRLNSDSAVAISLSSTERLVQLRRGQAYFEVAHDQRRPFRVAVDGLQVVAVGTRFDVYRRDSGAVVTVVDGRVAVLPAATTASQTGLKPSAGQILGAGQRLRIAPGSAAIPEAVDVAQAEAWLHRQVIFRNRPLGEVVEEFNRYGQTHIEMTDPAARAIVVSGVFDAYDTDSFLAFIGATDGLLIQDVSPGNKLIRHARKAQ
jgi:transmembrane sensor